MALRPEQYQALWRRLRVEGDTRGVGAALKTSMGNTTRPDTLLAEAGSAAAAMTGRVGDWDEVLERAANALLNLSTAQTDIRGLWLTFLDSSLRPKSFTGVIGRIGDLTPSAFVTANRRRIVQAIVGIFRDYDTPEESAHAGEAAVMTAYRAMYAARQKAYFKSLWTSTDTDAHLGSVWAAVVGLRVGVVEETDRVRIARQEEERRRRAAEEERESRARAEARDRKRLVRTLEVSDADTGYDKSAKLLINMTCEGLLNTYPVDVVAYNEDRVAVAVQAGRVHLNSEYGYQLSGNRPQALASYDSLVAIARRKHYPLEDAAFTKAIVPIAVNLMLTGISGSDLSDMQSLRR